MADAGEYVGEQEIEVKSSRDPSGKQMRVFAFLFTRLLLLCKKKYPVLLPSPLPSHPYSPHDLTQPYLPPFPPLPITPL